MKSSFRRSRPLRVGTHARASALPMARPSSRRSRLRNRDHGFAGFRSDSIHRGHVVSDLAKADDQTVHYLEYVNPRSFVRTTSAADAVALAADHYNLVVLRDELFWHRLLHLDGRGHRSEELNQAFTAVVRDAPGQNMRWPVHRPDDVRRHTLQDRRHVSTPKGRVNLLDKLRVCFFLHAS